MKVSYPTSVSLPLWIIALLLIAFLVQNYYSQQAQSLVHRQQEHQHKELLEATRKSGQVALMGHLIAQIEQELGQNQNRRLSRETLTKVAYLSDSFESDGFSYLTIDSLENRSYSQERGQLLGLLLEMRMDSTSFQQLKGQINFAQADLGGLSLRGVDLSGAQLQGANLQDADLTGANLSKADLKGANLWGAELVGANLQSAQLNRADMRWADLSESNLSESVLKGVKLSAAQLRKADLRKAIVHYAFAEGAFFNEVDLTEANLFGTDLRRAVFREAKLNKVDLRVTDMREAVLIQADMRKALLRDIRIQEQNWLELLAKWEVKGLQRALDTYEVIEDPTQQAPYALKIKSGASE